jgi:hypothetical protein
VLHLKKKHISWIRTVRLQALFVSEVTPRVAAKSDVQICVENLSLSLSVSLHWLYCPCRALASFGINFLASLSLAIFLQLLTSIFFTSFSTWSSHLFLGMVKVSRLKFGFHWHSVVTVFKETEIESIKICQNGC